MKLLLLTALLSTNFAFAQLTYPVAKKITQTETRFGTVIEDPYKWMENASDTDLWDWIEEQKSLTDSYLEPGLSDAFAARVLEMRKIQNEQNVITGKASPRPASKAIPWTEDDLRSMGMKEKKLIRWGLKSNLKSLAESSESSLYEYKSTAVYNGDLRRVIITQKSDNKVVDILLVKFFTFVTWADDKSFYYLSDLDEHIGGGRPGLFRHSVGEMQSEDQLLLASRSASGDLTVHEVGKRFFVEVDGTIGALHLATGKVTNRLPIQGEVIEVTEAPEIEATIRTFDKADKGEFQKLRLRDGLRRVFLKEQAFVLDKAVDLKGESTLVLGLVDGSHVAGVLDLSGNLKMISDLQDGTITFVSFENGVLKLAHETYSQPKKIYSYTLATGELKLLAAQTFPIEVEAEKITYTAANGQGASMWVIKKKGATLTSKTPLILYGYGGFKISLTPTFNIYESLPWFERGGAFAVVTLPGSLDYGNSWYELARVSGRTNSFDSFALAAKTLFAKGYTSADHIGMMGASNGGTLVAGTLQRHSEVFKAAVPMVGVMDLINFTLFTAGKYWTNDYGNPFVEKDFKGIYPLSPYHQLKKRDYPATMVMTAEFDDRVVPMHSYKYLARLQEYNTSVAPILLYNKEWGGHARASGSSRESSKYVAAFYTFFAQQLGL